MKVAVALILLLTTHTYCFSRTRAQLPSPVGRWHIDLTFTDTTRHTVRFDAEDSGKGSYLLLDTRSNLLEPPEPSDAEWAQTGGWGVTFSGQIEFPIGNVGRDAGTLVFKGTFETADSIAGEVEFYSAAQNLKGPALPSKTGTFTATRVAAEGAPSVRLVSQNTGGKLRRGHEVEVSWRAQSDVPISLQQIFLSLDDGESFVPITAILEGDVTDFAWIVPETLPKSKKALLKIIVINVSGDSGQDVSRRPFRIK